MAGFGPKLPFTFDKVDGVKLTKNLVEEIRQNFKHLVLTQPGERVMDVEFGVGLLSFLFDFDSPSTRANVIARIKEQVSIYMPYVVVQNVSFFRREDNLNIQPNELRMIINYYITTLNEDDVLEVRIEP